jgi:SAM-dependent methyltransferase
MTSRDWNRLLVESYDRVAEQYTEQFFNELDRKPFDRDLLDRYADTVRGHGKVCDLGCGPGHVARYLRARGVEVVGVDISPRMVEVARQFNPGIPFDQGDMRALDVPDSSLAGVVAFYSIIHLARSVVPRALDEMMRVLRPGGVALISVHGGEGELHADEFLGQTVSIDASLFQPPEMKTLAEGAGFKVEEVLSREPYDFEFQSQRVYIWASRVPV